MKLFIVMEYCSGGSLRDLVLKRGQIQEIFVSIIIREILRGLEYLHSTARIHRDIKPANILLTDKGEVKIADFGVSAELTRTLTKRDSFVGTPNWMAPEMLDGAKHNSKVDIWALGITAINLATAKIPYDGMKPFYCMKAIKENEPPRLEGEFTDVFKDFVA